MRTRADARCDNRWRSPARPRIEVKGPVVGEWQPSLLTIPEPAVMFFPGSAVRMNTPVTILAHDGFTWQHLSEEPTMNHEWLPKVRESLARELAAVPEVIGLYTMLEGEELALWVLVGAEAPDLEYRIASAIERVWGREGYRQHDLVITCRPEFVPPESAVEFERAQG